MFSDVADTWLSNERMATVFFLELATIHSDLQEGVGRNLWELEEEKERDSWVLEILFLLSIPLKITVAIREYLILYGEESSILISSRLINPTTNYRSNLINIFLFRDFIIFKVV